MLRRCQQVGERGLERLVHPLDAGQRTVAVGAANRAAAEIHDVAEQPLRDLTLLFHDQTQLTVLLVGERHTGVIEDLFDDRLHVIERIRGGHLTERKARERTHDECQDANGSARAHGVHDLANRYDEYV